MAEKKQVEISCRSCGADAFLIRRPCYEGLTKTGEALTCSSCGHVYEKEEDVPFRRRAAPRVFTEADRSGPVEIFQEDEKGRICRYCVSYIVNPFTQWCAVHKKEVEATDACSRFERKKEDPPHE